MARRISKPVRIRKLDVDKLQNIAEKNGLNSIGEAISRVLYDRELMNFKLNKSKKIRRGIEF